MRLQKGYLYSTYIHYFLGQQEKRMNSSSAEITSLDNDMKRPGRRNKDLPSLPTFLINDMIRPGRRKKGLSQVYPLSSSMT
jgi:hypothetical protein